MKFRFYLRTLRFVAYHWAIPFFVGMAISMLIVVFTEDQIFQLMTRAFDQSFQAVISSCAQ